MKVLRIGLRIVCIFFAVVFGLTAFSCFYNLFAGNQPSSALSLIITGILMIALTALCILGAKKAGTSGNGFGGKLLPESKKYIPGEPLPIVPSGGLILSSAEVCHICYSAKIGKMKTITTGSVTTRSGSSVRVMRGLSVSSGTSRRRTIRKDILDTSPGTFYVTNKRVIASSQKYSFDKPLGSLSTYTLYTDGFSLQFGKDMYMILIKDPTYVLSILNAAMALKSTKK